MKVLKLQVVLHFAHLLFFEANGQSFAAAHRLGVCGCAMFAAEA